MGADWPPLKLNELVTDYLDPIMDSSLLWQLVNHWRELERGEGHPAVLMTYGRCAAQLSHVLTAGAMNAEPSSPYSLPGEVAPSADAEVESSESEPMDS